MTLHSTRKVRRSCRGRGIVIYCHHTCADAAVTEELFHGIHGIFRNGSSSGSLLDLSKTQPTGFSTTNPHGAASTRYTENKSCRSDTRLSRQPDSHQSRLLRSKKTPGVIVVQSLTPCLDKEREKSSSRENTIEQSIDLDRRLGCDNAAERFRESSWPPVSRRAHASTCPKIPSSPCASARTPAWGKRLITSRNSSTSSGQERRQPVLAVLR